jgi:hypothetical protein
VSSSGFFWRLPPQQPTVEMIYENDMAQTYAVNAVFSTAMVLISVGQIVVLVHFVLVHRRPAFSAINLHLSMIIGSDLCIWITESFVNFQGLTNTTAAYVYYANIMTPVHTFLYVNMNVACLLRGYSKSTGIDTFPCLFKFVEVVMKVFPYLYYCIVPIDILGAIMSSTTPHSISRVIGLVFKWVTLGLDLIFLTAFMSSLKKTKVNETGDVDSTFRIVARHGTIVSFLFFISVGLAIAFTETNYEPFRFTIYSLFNIMAAVIFAMKVAVFKNREKMKREDEAKLVRVLGSELDAIRRRSEKVASNKTLANGAVSDLTLLR